MNKFKIKTEVRFGNNALDALGEFYAENAVIITDSFMEKSGVADQIKNKLINCSNVSIFSEVTPDPPIELVAKALDFLKSHDADVIVALGGGSSIDAAKAVVLMDKNVTGKKMKLIAIPTTSGTGSEVTQFSVITDKASGVKYPLIDESLLPDIAILDPSLVVTVPKSVTADTGFDVITHALEAYISTLANDASDALAEKALTISFKYLPRAFKDGSNLVAREKMHSASCLAGMAFNEVSLGINHSIAHQLGAKFHIPHGKANAMLLPYVVEFNADLDGSFGTFSHTETAFKLADIARRLGLPGDNIRIGVHSLIEEIKYMKKMMGIPATLEEAGVTKEAYELNKTAIIEGALKDACTQTNPKKVTDADIENILNNIAVW